jgi:hypothetical protein
MGFGSFLGQNILFGGGSRVFLNFWEWSEGLGAKDMALAKCGIFSGIFG